MVKLLLTCMNKHAYGLLISPVPHYCHCAGKPADGILHGFRYFRSAAIIQRSNSFKIVLSNLTFYIQSIWLFRIAESKNLIWPDVFIGGFQRPDKVSWVKRLLCTLIEEVGVRRCCIHDVVHRLCTSVSLRLFIMSIIYKMHDQFVYAFSFLACLYSTAVLLILA